SVALEKRHVSSNGVDLDAEMSREEIYGIFDELSPRRERGKEEFNLGDGGDLTTVDGGTVETTAAYENVLLQMYGKEKKVGPKRYVAAMVQWKKRNCHGYPAGPADTR